MGRYLEIASQVIAEQDACKASTIPESVSALGELPYAPTPNHEPDPYAKWFLALIDRMRANPMSPECLPWLAENNVALHRLLTSVLQDKLEELWDKRAPIGAFQFILDRIWDTHRTARELYGAHLAAQTEPNSTPKTTSDLFRTPLGDGDRPGVEEVE